MYLLGHQWCLHHGLGGQRDTPIMDLLLCMPVLDRASDPGSPKLEPQLSSLLDSVFDYLGFLVGFQLILKGEGKLSTT